MPVIREKAEHRRIDAFELWRRFLRVPWTERRSNQSIIKEISLEYSLEELMLKLKLQNFATWCEELTHFKRPWCWERLRAGGEGDDRGLDGWMASMTQWTWVWVDSGSWWWTGRPGVLRFSGSQRVRHDWATELNWTDSKFSVIPTVELEDAKCFKIYPFNVLPLLKILTLMNITEFSLSND